jgi:hypothetical protein
VYSLLNRFLKAQKETKMNGTTLIGCYISGGVTIVNINR